MEIQKSIAGEIKLKRIARIEKSFKYEGYCFITTIDGKSYKRKCYERKTGVFKDCILVNFGTDVFSFQWKDKSNNADAINIQYVGNYKTVKEAEEAASNEPETPSKPPVIEVSEDGEVKHEKYNTIKTCIQENIPVYLVGPAGSGKNHTLEQIAWELGLEFYFTNSVQQEYKLTGFIDAGGNYHETEFYRAFVNGGLFFLDEMDASIPEVLVLLNAAIANGYFEFPTGKVEAHKNFRVVAAGNTVGNGADERYTGRLVLDQATLDRFAIIEFDYDLRIEMAISKNNAELVSFIRGLRKQAEEKGIRATFSYRCITMVTKLEGKLAVEEILVMAVFKGMDKDTIRTFRPEGHDKYSEALKRVQG